MSEGNTLVHFKSMLVILIVIISNIVSALWAHLCLHIHHIVMVWAPLDINASSAYGLPIKDEKHEKLERS